MKSAATLLLGFAFDGGLSQAPDPLGLALIGVGLIALGTVASFVRNHHRRG